jgi:bicarbonate transport system substrate-binding protein
MQRDRGQLLNKANWGSTWGNVEVGSVGGSIDGGQWQIPVPYLVVKYDCKTTIPMYILSTVEYSGILGQTFTKAKVSDSN